VLKRGHLYWAKVPNDKRRPVLILSPDIRNELANDVIVAPVSTILRHGPWHVRLRKGEAGISQASIIKCEQITTVRKEIISSQALGGSLSATRMKHIERSVLRAIGVPIQEP